ncbi:MAG: T9SS type A sorting domain-containing protein [Phycisphaerae bacterium]|nr:T9SS type A sorting domain-containing protein [Saprospiraceae bacterium]
MKNIYFFCGLTALLCSNKLVSQTNWTRCSQGLPDGKVILSLAKMNATLFAGVSKAGVFKSDDFGNSWLSMPAHPAFVASSTSSMAVIDTFLFAGVIGKGVLKTSLNDTSWTLLANGLLNKSVQDLIAVNDTLYAATYGGGVFYSGDMGNSWSTLYNNQGMDDHKVYSLASNTTSLFAGTIGTDGLPDTGVAYRAILGGSTWTRINSGFIRNGVHLEQVFSIAANDTLVFAGTDDVGLYRSTDNGDNWVPVGGFDGDVLAIEIAGTTVYYGTAHHGVFRSLDAGQTWSADNTGLAFGNLTLPTTVKDLLVVGSVIYASSDIGVFKQDIPNFTSGVQHPPEAASIQLNNFPNPFSAVTTIQFYNPSAGSVSLSLFDMTGKLLAILLQKEMPEGYGRVDFDGRNLPVGLYYVQLETKGAGVFQAIKIQKHK